MGEKTLNHKKANKNNVNKLKKASTRCKLKKKNTSEEKKKPSLRAITIPTFSFFPYNAGLNFFFSSLHFNFICFSYHPKPSEYINVNWILKAAFKFPGTIWVQFSEITQSRGFLPIHEDLQQRNL